MNAGVRPVCSHELSICGHGFASIRRGKQACDGLHQSLAAGHASERLRINALLPGGTVTPAGGEGDPEALKFVSDLLSDRSQFITGSPMIVDGACRFASYSS